MKDINCKRPQFSTRIDKETQELISKGVELLNVSQSEFIRIAVRNMFKHKENEKSNIEVELENKIKILSQNLMAIK